MYTQNITKDNFEIEVVATAVGLQTKSASCPC